MWLATKFGFYSIVQKEPADESTAAVFHVRARLRHDLENLLQAARLRKEIEEWPGADYRYRFLGTEADVRQIMACLAAHLDYNNFKSKIGCTADQKKKLDAYHKVWSELARVQR